MNKTKYCNFCVRRIGILPVACVIVLGRYFITSKVLSAGEKNLICNNYYYFFKLQLLFLMLVCIKWSAE